MTIVIQSIQIICNFSSNPESGKPVYNTKKHDTNGYTVRCGCPPGFDEDPSCLCGPSEGRGEQA